MCPPIVAIKGVSLDSVFYECNNQPVSLNQMRIFVEVVEAGSFTAAAESLGLSKSSVSRKVAELESRLGVQLLRRTTRKIALTDVGEIYYARCRTLVAEAEAADRLVTELHGRPCGLLRVTLPPTFAFLGGIVAEYLQRYPDVRVEMVCTERRVDLVDERFDVAVRAGPLPDSTLIARKLGAVHRLLVASPDYEMRRGLPSKPDDLRDHDATVFGGGREGEVWTLKSADRRVDLRPTPRLIADDYELLLEASLSGLGISFLPDYVCNEALENGTLVRVLPGWISPETPIRAVYSASRHPTTKLTAFLDLLKERFSPSH